MVEGRFNQAFKTWLAGDALDVCRRRMQIAFHGSRGRKHIRSTKPAERCTPAHDHRLPRHQPG